MTLLLDALGDRLALDGQVLVYLLAVVVVSLVGGILVAIGSAVASALLLNYFFVEPVHTLSVGDPDQLVALIVFVAVAALVSGAIELAVKASPDGGARQGRGRDDVGARRARARRRRFAAPDPRPRPADVRHGVGDAQGRAPRAAGNGSMPGMPAGRRPAPRPRCASTSRSGHGLRMVGRGPALFAEDGRVLEAFAAAARTAYEGQRAERRGRGGARRWRRSTGSARPSSPRSGTTCAPRSPGSRRRSSSLRQTTSSGLSRSARELLATIEDVGGSARRGDRQPARRQPPAGRRARRRSRAESPSTRSSPRPC